jgi:hypothetical protein
MVAIGQRRQPGEAVHAIRLKVLLIASSAHRSAPPRLASPRLASLSALRQCLPCEVMLKECACR